MDITRKNLAYDVHSVDVLLEEARDRWGDSPAAGGSEGCLPEVAGQYAFGFG